MVTLSHQTGSNKLRVYHSCLLIVLAGLSSCCFIAPEQHTATERDVNRLIVRSHQLADSGGYRLMTTESLQAIMASDRNPLVIDTLPPSRYEKHHIPEAHNFWFPRSPAPTIDWDTTLMQGQSLADFQTLLGADKNRPLIFYCGRTICDRSHSAAAWAVKLGYKNVYRYAGGIDAWRDLPWDGKENGVMCTSPQKG